MTEGIHYSKDFEAAVLGICLLEKTAFDRTHGLIDGRSFYFEDNQAIYQAMSEMKATSAPIDLLTVWQWMIEKGTTLHAGEIRWYFSQLTMNVVSSEHLEYHCTQLKKMWRKRELEIITQSGIDPYQDERKQAFQVNEKINEILSGQVDQDWQGMDELMINLFRHQEEIKAGTKKLITTGFHGIDRLNGGFWGGQLIVLGARPSVGKSALMGKMAISMAKAGKSVGIISLEMNNTEIAGRLASIETNTDFSVIYRNLFQDENQARSFYDKIGRVASSLPIYVSDKTQVDVSEIRSKATKLKRSRGLDFLMVDYLQLIETTSTNRNYNREQEVSKLSRGLKVLAMELDIPVMILCQLNRESTKRKGNDRYPKLADLRESGAIEQDADAVLMLHRDWMADVAINPVTGGTTEFSADLFGLKWRSGAQFHLELEFNPTLMKFSEHPSSNLIPISFPKNEGDPF
jgi:replicative DNA helicase